MMSMSDLSSASSSSASSPASSSSSSSSSSCSSNADVSRRAAFVQHFRSLSVSLQLDCLQSPPLAIDNETVHIAFSSLPAARALKLLRKLPSSRQRELICILSPEQKKLFHSLVCQKISDYSVKEKKNDEDIERLEEYEKRKRNLAKEVFITVIMKMMHAFGDSLEPDVNAAIFLQDHIHQWLDAVWHLKLAQPASQNYSSTSAHHLQGRRVAVLQSLYPHACAVFFRWRTLSKAAEKAAKADSENDNENVDDMRKIEKEEIEKKKKRKVEDEDEANIEEEDDEDNDEEEEPSDDSEDEDDDMANGAKIASTRTPASSNSSSSSSCVSNTNSHESSSSSVPLTSATSSPSSASKSLNSSTYDQAVADCHYEFYLPAVDLRLGPRHRLYFQNALTTQMSASAYAIFCNCREASFVLPLSNAKKFLQWIAPTAPSVRAFRSSKAGKNLLLLLGYLAWDRVGMILEICNRLRQFSSDKSVLSRHCFSLRECREALLHLESISECTVHHLIEARRKERNNSSVDGTTLLKQKSELVDPKEEMQRMAKEFKSEINETTPDEETSEGRPKKRLKAEHTQMSKQFLEITMQSLVQNPLLATTNAPQQQQCNDAPALTTVKQEMNEQHKDNNEKENMEGVAGNGAAEDGEQEQRLTSFFTQKNKRWSLGAKRF